MPRARKLFAESLYVAKVAYFALFEFHLRYGIAAWGEIAGSSLQQVLIKKHEEIDAEQA